MEGRGSRRLQVEWKTLERSEEIMGGMEWEEVEEVTHAEWYKLGGVMETAAREVCGEGRGRVENPWMIGREEDRGAVRERDID